MRERYRGCISRLPRFNIQVDLNTEGRIAHVYLVLSSSKLTAMHF